MVATHWLKQELKNTQDVLKNGKISISLSSVLANFKENEKKNTLAEKRKQYMRECIMGQFNVRFLYRSR
jgi:prolyl oligopeptidase PreP (S9A serine peptidase family)